MSKTRTITPNEPADFVPSKNDVNYLRPFRVWCQKVLPLIYDDSLSYYELLCKVVDYLNKTMKEVNQLGIDVSNLFNAFQQLQDYVNNYFSTLDVQEEINNKIDDMVTDGTFSNLIEPFLSDYTNELASVNAKYNNLQTQVNNLVLQSGNPDTTSAEIAQARGSYSTLNDRLTRMLESKGRLSSAPESPLNDLNTFPMDSVYELFGEGYTGVLNKPVKDGNFATVFSFVGNTSNVESSSTGIQLFISMPDTVLYMRAKVNNKWSDWKTVLTKTYDIFTSFGRLTTEQINPLNDLNTFPKNTCYELYDAAWKNCLNRPISGGDFATILTFSGNPINNKNISTAVQFALTTIDNGFYYRMSYASKWGAWQNTQNSGGSGENVISINNDITSPQEYSNSIINGNGHTIELGTVINGSSPGLQEIPFEYTTGDLLDKCFISKTLGLEDESSARSAGYNVTLWDEDNNKLVPTLNASPANGQFTYDGTKLIINSQKTKFILNSLTENYGAIFENCKVYNLKILHSYNSSAFCQNNCEFYGCEFGYSSIGDGLKLSDCNAKVENCKAYYNRNDGFNIHCSTRTSSVFINCKGYNNFDDGISHHDTANFSIIGGEYYNNAKGGVSSPTYGSNGTIIGVYSHDNKYGVYSVSETQTNETVIITDCIIENNNVGVLVNNYDMILHNVSLINNTTNKQEAGGTIVEK